MNFIANNKKKEIHSSSTSGVKKCSPSELAFFFTKWKIQEVFDNYPQKEQLEEKAFRSYLLNSTLLLAI